MTQEISIQLQRRNLDYLLWEGQRENVILFLHGFPDNAYIWKQLMAELASGSGFGPGPRSSLELPSMMAPFAPGTFAGDALNVKALRLETYANSLAQALKAQFPKLANLVLVGHDMGGAYLEKLAEVFPQTRALVYIDTLPLGVFKARLKGPRQWFQSSYMLLFQAPIHPESMLGRFYPRLREWVEKAAGPSGRAPSEMGPEVLNGLAFYRALARDTFAPSNKSQAPYYFLWGEGDRAISMPSAQELKNLGASLEVVGKGHWPMLSEPKALAQRISSIAKGAVL